MVRTAHAQPPKLWVRKFEEPAKRRIVRRAISWEHFLEIPLLDRSQSLPEKIYDARSVYLDLEWKGLGEKMDRCEQVVWTRDLRMWGAW